MSLNLNNLLIELGHKDAPLRLTIDEIVNTITAFRENNNQENPNTTSGTIEHGPLAGKTNWNALNQALQFGYSGLNQDTEWIHFSKKAEDQKLTLYKLLIILGYEEKDIALTIDNIITTIDAYRLANNQNNPAQKSGLIRHGPLKDQLYWHGIDRSLKLGSNGLKDDPKWEKLRDQFGGADLSLHKLLIALKYKGPKTPLTVKLVIEAIETYIAKNKKLPTVCSEYIKHKDLRSKVRWDTLNAAISSGSNGLKEDNLWIEHSEKLGNTKPSLNSFLIDLGYKNPPPTIALIKNAIELYRLKNNQRNPACSEVLIDSEANLGSLTWRNLDQVIRFGARGLKDDPEWQNFDQELGSEQLSLKKLLIMLGYERENLVLTIDIIKKTINAHMEANEGKLPRGHFGMINHGPLSNRLKWSALNMGLDAGAHNLNQDAEWQDLKEKSVDKALTLNRTLQLLGYKEPEQVFTMEEIIQTIDAYKVANDDKIPGYNSGKIKHGPLAGKKTWRWVDRLLSNGSHGLKEDPEWIALSNQMNGKPSTLKNTMITLGYLEACEDLTIDKIKQSIDLHKQNNNQENPNIKSGTVQHGVYAQQRTWQSINQSLSTGGSGLSSDLKWQELTSLSDECKLSLSRLLILWGYKAEDLTIENICLSISSYKEKHKKIPLQNAMIVDVGPYSGLLSWRVIARSLETGSNSLKNDPDWQNLNEKLDGLSFAKLVEHLGYQSPKPKLSINNIVKTIQAFIEKNDSLPNSTMLEISCGPLKGATTWRALDASLKFGHNGLKENKEWKNLNKNSGESELSLNKLLIHLGYKDVLTELNMTSIIATLEAYREKNGKNPTQTSGDILEGPLAGKMKWDTLNACMVFGRKGLDRDPTWISIKKEVGKKRLSLSNLAVYLGHKEAKPEITIDDIELSLKAHWNKNNKTLPTRRSGQILHGPLKEVTTWGSLNSALPHGGLGLKDDFKWQAIKKDIGNRNLSLSVLFSELGYIEKPIVLTIDMIIEAIKNHKTHNKGREPSNKAGEIQHGPLANKTNWHSIDRNLKSGRHGLQDDPKWQRLNKKYDGELSLYKLREEYSSFLHIKCNTSAMPGR